MAKILITSGPTRQYLDPVRYLTNASSGKMGCALAAAALELGHAVVLVSGPVEISYPPRARVISVISTEEMLAAALAEFPACDGLIGVAAPCDYRPQQVAPHKIRKTGEPLELHLIETPDIVATLCGQKRADQWAVGFALETEDARFRAVVKLQKKSCDLMVANGPQAMNSPDNQVEILDRGGEVIAALQGNKSLVARQILHVIEERLIRPAAG
ncbi:MAG: phosphopantothenoylcysteine decarboxylase [Pirellulales bacterium]|nr:phosphopantothenoylcysteine decarboxylase [Pirellulales bacterium]